MSTSKYQYVPGPLSKERTICLDSNKITLSIDGQTTTSITLAEIKSLRVMPSCNGVDPESGEFRMKTLKIVPKSGRSIKLMSGSCLGIGTPVTVKAKNQFESYDKLVNRLKGLIAEQNPGSLLVVGSTGAAIAFSLLAIMGLAIAAVGILVALWSPIHESWQVVASCLFGGLLVASKSHLLADLYGPIRVPLAVELESEN